MNAVLAVGLALGIGSARAQTPPSRTWTGAAATGNFTDSGNWSGSSVPTSAFDQDVTFSAAGTAQTIKMPSGGFTLDDITFSGASRPAYTFVGPGTFTLTGIISTTTSGGDVVFASSLGITLARDPDNNIHTVSLADNSTVRLESNINEVIGTAGAGSFIKSGNGTFTLSGSNSFTGGITLNAGTLNLNSATAPGTGTLIIDGGTIDNTSGVAITLTNNNAQTWGSNFTFGGTNNLNLGTGAVSLTGNRTVTIDGGSLTVGGVIDEPASARSLTKAGPGTLILTGANAYGGNTIISAGTLQIGNGGTSGSVAGNIVDNAALVFNRSDSPTFSGAISGTGTLTKLGAGTLTLSGNNTYTGSTAINSGTVQFAQESSLKNTNWTAAKFTVASGATAAFNVGGTGEFTSNDFITFAALGSATGGFQSGSTLALDTSNAAGGTFTHASAIANPNGGANLLGLAKLGTGTLILTGASTYTGGTTVKAGTLQIGAGGTAGSIAGNVVNNAELAFSRSDAVSFGGVISGSGNLTLQGGGNFTLTGLNTYSGTTTIIQGSTLTAGTANTLPAATQVAVSFGALVVNASQLIAGLSGSNTGNVTIAGSQTLTLNNATNNSFGGLISGGGAFVKNGAGTLTLTNANTYTGGTTVNAGNLILNNTGSSGTGTGDVTVGSGATLTVSPGNAAGSVSGNIANSGAVVFARTDPNTYAGVISGPGTFEKKSSGNLTLTGANTYGGTTTLSGGTLTIGVTNALPTSAQISLALGSILNVANDQTIAGFTGADGSGASILLGLGKTLTVAMPVANTSTTFAGSVSGDGVFAVSGAGNDIVNLTGSVTNSGGTVVGDGASLVVASGGSISGPITTNGILSFGNSGSQVVSNVISGTGGLSTSAGTTTLTAANLYSGPTSVAGGKLIVSNTSGSATGTGTVTVSSGGILGGSGFISGPLVLGAGGTVSPGNSPGNLSVGPTTFAGGATFAFDLNDAQGSPGTNWDLLSISGTLTITATSASPFVINLVSLDSANNPGLAQNFNPAQSYSWQFVTSTGITGLTAPDVFDFSTSQFQNSLAGGTFGVSQVGNSLFLDFTPVPEPSTWALLSLGAAALAFGAWRRRRSA